MVAGEEPLGALALAAHASHANCVPMPSPDLDRWLGAPALRTTHRRAAHAPPDALWQAAMGVRLRDCRLLGRMVRARLGLRDGEMTFESLFRSEPFLLLDSGPAFALSGLCGRIWSTRRDFGRLVRPADFETWREPGTVRVLFAHWAEPAGTGAAIASEVRVDAVDRRGARNLQPLRPLVSAFQGLIGVECLALAVRRAEQIS
jgi:hypothetical protein